MDLALDVNTEIYRLKEGNKFRMVLSKSLTDEQDDGEYKPTKGTLADKFEYVMYGKVFKFSEEKQGGDLVMCVRAVWCYCGSTAPAPNDLFYVLAVPAASPLSLLRSAYASFGGLLMKLTGSPAHLRDIELDSRIYLLLKKIGG
jgi:DNA-directed RNA polymerases I, II, and III subunit RPABC3